MLQSQQWFTELVETEEQLLSKAAQGVLLKDRFPKLFAFEDALSDVTDTTASFFLALFLSENLSCGRLKRTSEQASSVSGLPAQAREFQVALFYLSLLLFP